MTFFFFFFFFLISLVTAVTVDKILFHNVYSHLVFMYHFRKYIIVWKWAVHQRGCWSFGTVFNGFATSSFSFGNIRRDTGQGNA